MWGEAGWSVRVYRSYGLTFGGIREVLSLLKINAVVAVALDALKSAIAGVVDRAAIVTSHGTICRGERDNHAISVFVQKRAGKVNLFINDSEASNYDKHCLDDEKVKVCIIASRVKRQVSYETTCNAFAIEDCRAFQDDPELLDKLETLDGNLPPSMMTLVGGERAKEKALEYQILLIESVIKKGRF